MLVLVLGLLQTLFIFCKLAELTAIAAWSWWAIFTPAWIAVGLLFLYMFIVGFVAYWETKN